MDSERIEKLEYIMRCEYPEYFDDEEEYEETEDDYAERMEQRNIDRVNECHCGALRLGKNGELLIIADCIC